MAEAMNGPLGRRSLQSVIREFLRFFATLRATGASWPQIAALLAAAGLRSAGGAPVSDGMLRAMVTRARKRPAKRGIEIEPQSRSRPAAQAPAPTASSQRQPIRPSASTVLADGGTQVGKQARTNSLSLVTQRMKRAAELRQRKT